MAKFLASTLRKRLNANRSGGKPKNGFSYAEWKGGKMEEDIGRFLGGIEFDPTANNREYPRSPLNENWKASTALVWCPALRDYPKKFWSKLVEAWHQDAIGQAICIFPLDALPTMQCLGLSPMLFPLCFLSEPLPYGRLSKPSVLVWLPPPGEDHQLVNKFFQFFHAKGSTVLPCSALNGIGGDSIWSWRQE